MLTGHRAYLRLVTFGATRNGSYKCNYGSMKSG